MSRSRRRHRHRLPRGIRIALLLGPALAVVGALFLGGLGLGFAQSLGYRPFAKGWSWSTAAYSMSWHDRAVRASIGLTLRVAIVSTGVSAVLGVAAALLIRSLGRGRRLTAALFQSNLPVPHLVGALSMLLLLQQNGFVSRLTHAAGASPTPSTCPAVVYDRPGWGIIAEYVWKETPFVGVVVLSALSSGVKDLEDVARTLGAGAWHRFRHVVLPIITPGVLATSIIVFAFSFGSYEVPYLLGRPYPATLPVVAYQFFSDVDLNARPQAMAISVGIAVFVGGLVAAYLAIAQRVVRR